MQFNVDRLRAYMQEKGLTQVQFSMLTGVAQPEISRVFGGRRGIGITVAGKILRAMPVELWNELLQFDDGNGVFDVYHGKRSAKKRGA